MTENVNLPTQYQQYIHRSRYARWNNEKKRRETWTETVTRYLNFWKNKYPSVLTDDLYKELYENITQLRTMPSMRALMTAGKALEKDNVAGFNCSYSAIDNFKKFDEIMYILMCGTGVGFSVERQYVVKLPTVAEDFYPSETIIKVSDSKLGWASSYRELISLLYAGKIPTWDLTSIRPSGALLKTFGGRASGPAPLHDLFKFTVTLFKSAAGRKLTSLECHDLVCKIAEIVVVGGVRRSALISLSNLSDDRMRSAKNGAWWEDNVQRALANNSAAYTEKPDIGIFMKEWLSLYDSKSGERGIFNREAANKLLPERRKLFEYTELGTNPCCFSGDMKLLTDAGYKTFSELSKMDVVNIVNNDGEVTKGKVWSSGTKPVVSVQFEDKLGKSSIICTDDHIFMLNDGTECQAKDLTKKRLMPQINIKVPKANDEFLAGFILGGRGYPETLKNLDSLSGLYSANGSVIKNQRVSLKAIDKNQIDLVAEYLAELGIDSYITTNGEYLCKQSYDLNITRYESILKFAELVSFGQKYKRESLQKMILERAPYVKTVKNFGECEVFDFTEPKTHWGIVEGCVVHNSEIILRSAQFCNLSEVVVRSDDNLESLKNKVRVATILGTLQATLTNFRYISKEWKKNTEEEALLGVSFTGIMDNSVMNCSEGEETLKSWLTELKQVAIDTNVEYANKLGINPSAAITCVKPSGTVSQLVDSASGIHPRYSPYYIRTVRADVKDPLAQFMKNLGFVCEPDVTKPETTVVFSFPQKSPPNSVFRDDRPALEQLELWKIYQLNWCEHKPSVTIYVKEHEWLEVGAWVYKHFDILSGVSFLPHSNHSYKQAPYQECTEEEYNALLEKYKDLDLNWESLSQYEMEDYTTSAKELACVAGICEI
jgi:hypothetical protein